MTILTNGQAHGAANGTSSNGETAVPRTAYLVTGASRGIGKGLIAAFLLRPNSIVIACVRNVESSTPSLESLPKASNSTLIILKLDCASSTDAADAIHELQTTHGVTYLDVVIANAAIATNYGPASTMQLEHLQNHMMINTYSVLLLFQATRMLMQQVPKGTGRQAKFVFIGAPIGTITKMEEVARAPLSAYGVTKLAANYLVRKFHFENKWLVAFVVDPGHVQTDMGDQGARLMGRKEAPTTLETSVNGICARIDEATKESSSGKFLCHEDGSSIPW